MKAFLNKEVELVGACPFETYKSRKFMRWIEKAQIEQNKTPVEAPTGRLYHKAYHTGYS